MPSRRETGRLNRNIIKRVLEDEGWEVAVVEKSGKYQGGDLWGADLLAVKGLRMMAVQCKTANGS